MLRTPHHSQRIRSGSGRFAVCLVALLTLIPNAKSLSQTDNVFSTIEEIQGEFDSVPCRRQDRLPAVRALFQKMGAKPEELTSQKRGTAENLVVHRPSVQPGEDTVVIGAHYDFTGGGCGAIDNWSGIVALAHLYRTIGQFTPRKKVLFVAFDREEEGQLGSGNMARAIKKEEIPHYCAMINLDSFGLAVPFALSNRSSASLVRLSEEVAATLQIPFYRVSIGNADADSSSFLSRKIPAVTLSGLSKDWDSILHTNNDQAVKVQPGSIHLGYRLALSLWERVDEAPCDAFRDR